MLRVYTDVLYARIEDFFRVSISLLLSCYKYNFYTMRHPSFILLCMWKYFTWSCCFSMASCHWLLTEVTFFQSMTRPLATTFAKTRVPNEKFNTVCVTQIDWQAGGYYFLLTGITLKVTNGHPAWLISISLQHINVKTSFTFTQNWFNIQLLFREIWFSTFRRIDVTHFHCG